MNFNKCLSIERQSTPSAVVRVVRTITLVILLLVWVTASVSLVRGQQRRGQPQQGPPAIRPSPSDEGSPGIFTDSDRDYLIYPGDVIEIQIEDAPELSRHHRVTAAGDIEMPVLGLVKVRGRSTYELARVIAEGLREKDYLKTPNVMVTVRQYNSRAFFIQGAVNKPGLYQLEGRPSLLTIISLAGGLTENHGSTIFILRPIKTQIPAPQTQAIMSEPSPTSRSEANGSNQGAAPEYELIKVNLSALYKGQFEQNRRLEPGDIVNIPRGDVFFVAGEVRAPGSFILKDGTTLRQAISLAQGMTFRAKASQGIIFREDPVTGSRQEVKVDIGAVMSGKKDDIVVQANDVIIVPHSGMKSVGGTLLMAIGVSSIRVPIP